MDELKRAIEELREARQSCEALLREHQEASEALEALSLRVDRAREHMLSKEAACTALIRDLSNESLPIDFRDHSS